MIFSSAILLNDTNYSLNIHLYNNQTKFSIEVPVHGIYIVVKDLALYEDEVPMPLNC